ncbi:MAG: hypothetical protein K8R40_05360 [Anaerolineaceae bacterium]|nr:hypothetical protein [Anaerolineaceae bacterium]
MMMKKRRLKNKDWHIISAYLDGQLTEKQETAFEERLTQETDLRDALRQIEWTKTVLRKAPRREVPHHFILTRQMAAEAKRHQTRVVRQYGLVSGIASLTFLILAGFQLLPLFKIGMAPNFAMAPKEALMEESMMMEAEAIEELAVEEGMQMQEAPVVEAEPAEDVEAADKMAEGAEEVVAEEELIESAAVTESEETLNETTDSVEEEMQPPIGGGGLSLTLTPKPTEILTETPTAVATSIKPGEEFDANMEGGAPRAEETLELPKEERLIEVDASTEDVSTNEDEGLFDQSSIETGESLTKQPSVLKMLAFAGMLLSALTAIIALVAVFRTKNRS